MRAAIALAFLFACAPTAADAATWAVAQDGSGHFLTLGEGLAAAAPGDTIRVAPGRYAEWDLAIGHPLTIEGIGSPYDTIIDPGDSGAGILIAGVPAPGVHLRSLGFRNGLAFRGMLRVEDSVAHLADCTFVGEPPVYDGRMVYVHRSELHASGCRWAGGRRAAVLMVESSLAMSGCRFEGVPGGLETRYTDVAISETVFDGAAEHFPALYLQVASGHVERCSFENNRLRGHGAALCVLAGAITLRESVFRDNEALMATERTGGNAGGALMTGDVIDCTFERNVAARFGGGLLTLGGRVEDCVFRDNSALLGGGLVTYADDAPKPVHRCIFTGNSADGSGGAIAILGNETDVNGCTLVGNAAGAGSGIAIHEVIPGTATLRRTIIAWGAGGAAVSGNPAGTGFANVECTDVFGHPGGDWTGPLASWAGIAGNLAADPLFCDRFGGDFRLRAGSPCLPEASACGGIGAFQADTCGGVGLPARSWARMKGGYRPRRSRRTGPARRAGRRGARARHGRPARGRPT